MKSNPAFSEFNEFFLDFRESLIQNLFLMCHAVVIARTTNLNIIKDYLPQLLENEQTVSCSHYKRLIRFFNLSEPAQHKLIACILGMIFRILSGHIKYLVLDATVWESGTKCYHLLTLCIVYQGVAIPIYWTQLDKNGGHSSEQDRQDLFIEACKRYELSGKILLADREFIGEKWLLFLVSRNIDFIIRMSKTCYKIPISQSQGYVHSKLEKLATNAAKSRRGVFKKFQIKEHTYSVVIVKNDKEDPKEPLIYFISTLDDKRQILDGYRIRWRIENCFKHLKTNGFNLEDLNLRTDAKLLMMFAIVIMAYVLSIYLGLENKNEYMKKYKDKSKNLSVSYFRQGLSILKSIAWNFKKFKEFLINLFKKTHQGDWLYVQ